MLCPCCCAALFDEAPESVRKLGIAFLLDSIANGVDKAEAARLARAAIAFGIVAEEFVEAALWVRSHGTNPHAPPAARPLN